MFASLSQASVNIKGTLVKRTFLSVCVCVHAHVCVCDGMEPRASLSSAPEQAPQPGITY